MRLIFFIVDFLIILIVVGGLYVAYQEGKEKGIEKGVKKKK